MKCCYFYHNAYNHAFLFLHGRETQENKKLYVRKPREKENKIKRKEKNIRPLYPEETEVK